MAESPATCWRKVRSVACSRIDGGEGSKNDFAMRQSNRGSAENEAGGLMYRFLQCTAGENMTRHVTTGTRDGTLPDLETVFEKHDFNFFPLREEGKMLGIVTKFDFLRAFSFTTGQMVPHYDDLMKRPVAEVMTEAVVHIEPTAPLTRVLQLMVSLKARGFSVIGTERQLLGIISRE